MRKASKPRVSPFTGNPYGTYEGPRGSTKEWKDAFSETIDPETARKIVQDDSPWSILGIEMNSSIDIIKRAYRKLVLVYHPDKQPIDKKEWAEKEFIKIQAAYSMLVR